MLYYAIFFCTITVVIFQDPAITPDRYEFPLLVISHHFLLISSFYTLYVLEYPVDKKGFNGKIDPRIICDDSFITFEWLWLCESVITDYSGISVESALLNRKLYFYLYDRETYEKEKELKLAYYAGTYLD